MKKVSATGESRQKSLEPIFFANFHSDHLGPRLSLPPAKILTDFDWILVEGDVCVCVTQCIAMINMVCIPHNSQ